MTEGEISALLNRSGSNADFESSDGRVGASAELKQTSVTRPFVHPTRCLTQPQGEQQLEQKAFFLLTTINRDKGEKLQLEFSDGPRIPQKTSVHLVQFVKI